MAILDPTKNHAPPANPVTATGDTQPMAQADVNAFPMRPYARPTGRTDDAMRLRELIERATRSELYIPGGLYTLIQQNPRQTNYAFGTFDYPNTNLTPNFAGLHIRGDGPGRTILQSVPNANMGTFSFSKGEGLSLSALTIDGQARRLTPDGKDTFRNADGSFVLLQTVAGTHAVRVAAVRCAWFDRLHVKNAVAYGIAQENGQQEGIWYTHSLIENCGSDAIDSKDRPLFDGDPSYTGSKAMFVSSMWLRNWGLTDSSDAAVDCRGRWQLVNTLGEMDPNTKCWGFRFREDGEFGNGGHHSMGANLMIDFGGIGSGDRIAFYSVADMGTFTGCHARNGGRTGAGGGATLPGGANAGATIGYSAGSANAIDTLFNGAMAANCYEAYRDAGIRSTMSFLRAKEVSNMGARLSGQFGRVLFPSLVNMPLGVLVEAAAADTLLFWPAFSGVGQDITDAGARTTIIRSGWGGPLEVRAVSANVNLTSVDQGRLISVTTGAAGREVRLPTDARLVDRARFRIVKADTGAGPVGVYAGPTGAVLIETLTAQGERVEAEWDAAAGTYSIVGSDAATMLRRANLAPASSAAFASATFAAGVTHTVAANARSAAGSGSYAYGSTAGSTSERRHLSHADSNGQVWGWNTSGGALIGRFGTAQDLRVSLNSARTSFHGVPLSPGADNVISLGEPGNRFTQLYAAAGTINTSDAREKLDRDGAPLPAGHSVSPMTAAEIAAARALAREIGVFKFKDAAAAKGNAARLHVGLTVQRVMAIMAEHGLDPLCYAFICHDTWEAEADAPETVEAVLDDDSEPTGETVTHAAIPGRAAGDRYGFRTDELLFFIARGQEARLAALEASVEWLGA